MRCRLLMATTVLFAGFLQVTALAQTESVLHRFTGYQDGGVSLSNLVADAEGNLYGTTQNGGELCEDGVPFGCGTVFELSPEPDGEWEFRVLYRFHGGLDGSNPAAGLLLDSAGNLYGTTMVGGHTEVECCGHGTVFELQRAGQQWHETVLHSFHVRDGAYPMAPLVWGPDGALYGTTSNGGLTRCPGYYLNTLGCGVVFRLTNTASGWVEKVLHVFNGMDGAQLWGGVTFDQAGNIYGAAWEGGTGGGLGGGGTIYELTRSGGRWTETTLYNFLGTAGGPVGELSLDAFNNLYGASEFGGVYGYGSVFELSASGGGWILTTLHAFTGLSDGWFPHGGIVVNAEGDIYGTTSGSLTGICFLGCGLVYELNKSNGWGETVLHSFEGPDGALPWARLLLTEDGIYGTTFVGGVKRACVDPNFPGCGTVFKITQ